MSTEIRNTIQILIPVYNDAAGVDVTMRSIMEQDFDKNDIYISAVDFGSNDGSYEKLLSYPPYHFSVYQYRGEFSEGRMPALAKKTVQFVFGGSHLYQILLRPGDFIYPNCLKRLTEAVQRYRVQKPERLIELAVCNVDIMLENESILHQESLFEEELLIDPDLDLGEIQRQGYKRNVFCMGGNIIARNHRRFGSQNERIWWSKVRFHQGLDSIVYIPERLACIKERYYKDELREILVRWDELIIFLREHGRLENNDDPIKKELEREIALYALWRSFLMDQKADDRQTKECFQIASVICPEIKDTDAYRQMKKRIEVRSMS